MVPSKWASGIALGQWPSHWSSPSWSDTFPHMFVTFQGSIFSLLGWQWRSVLHFTLASTAAVVLEGPLGVELLELPNLPLAVVGAAIGIFVSFRTNACYDRWWEGRKLWGRLINVSRHFSNQVLTYLPGAESGEPTELQARLVRRHVAYVHALRAGLRTQSIVEDQEFSAMLPAVDRERVLGSSNPNHVLLELQAKELTSAAQRGELTEQRLQSFDQSLAQLLDVQGGCERIKKTPFPRTYGWIAERLVWAYSILFPLGVVEQLGWVTVPLTVLVCLAFTMISETGRVLEDPFTMFWPALPLSALSRIVEVNLRERLGETGLPPMLGPNERGILM